jgi:hypothetical protein
MPTVKFDHQSLKKILEFIGECRPRQIDKPLDRDAWWIEQRIRHPNLVDHVHDLHWYKLYLLEVMALFFTNTIIVVAIGLY